MPFDPVAACMRSVRRLYPILALAWIVVYVLSAQGIGRAPAPSIQTFLVDPNITAGCLGIFALYLFLPIRPRELAVVLLVGLFLEANFVAYRWNLIERVSNFLSVGPGLAAASLLVWPYRIWTSADRRLPVLLLLVAPLLPLAFMLSGFFHAVVIAANPLVYDFYAYAVDSALGFSPSFFTAGFVKFVPGLRPLVYWIYWQLPLWMVIAVPLSLRARSRCYYDPITAYCVAGAVGASLYNLYPLVGCEDLYSNFYPRHNDLAPLFWSPPPETPHMTPAANHLLRNCMPSMHTTWIVLAWLCYRRQPELVWRIVGAVALTGTLLGTLYMGHYFIDLVVAAPLVLLNVGLTARPELVDGKWRLAAILTGAALVAVALLSLRSASLWISQHPAVLVLGEVALVGVALWLEAKLSSSRRDPTTSSDGR